MKFTKLFFAFLLLSPVFTRAQLVPVTIRLTFDNPSKDTCQLIVDDNYIDQYNTISRAVAVNNEIIFTVNLQKPAVAYLSYHKKTTSLFLIPGWAILSLVSEDTSRGTLVLSRLGPENMFLDSFYRTFKTNFDKEKQKELMLTNTIDAYEMRLFEERKKQQAFYTGADRSKFPKVFTDFMEQTIRYTYFGGLLSYPIINANQSAKILRVNALPEVMLEHVTTKLMNDDALPCPAYREFIYYYVIYFTSKANGFNKFTDYNSSMERKVMTAKSDLTEKTKTWYTANFLNTDYDKVSPYTVKLIYTQLTEMDKDNTYSPLLKSKCEERMKVKEPVVKNKKKDADKAGNMPAADASKSPFGNVVLKDLEGKVFNPKDIEGKVVFVDFWASWCGPCRVEFPASKTLHDRFTEKELKKIVFLYISIDGSESAWKNAVKSIGMNGTLVISPGDWSSPIVKYFGINGIPRYMLIDKNGTIVNTDAPRPSSGDVIYNEIIKLLN
jgi:thiol-disulfide isomerase/thioredoxin